MRYRTFTIWNALGGICWAAIFGSLGYAFGRNLPLLEHYLGRVSLALLALVVVGAIVTVVVRRSRARRSPGRA